MILEKLRAKDWR